MLCERFLCTLLSCCGCCCLSGSASECGVPAAEEGEAEAGEEDDSVDVFDCLFEDEDAEDIDFEDLDSEDVLHIEDPDFGVRDWDDAEKADDDDSDELEERPDDEADTDDIEDVHMSSFESVRPLLLLLLLLLVLAGVVLLARLSGADMHLSAGVVVAECGVAPAGVGVRGKISGGLSAIRKVRISIQAL